MGGKTRKSVKMEKRENKKVKTSKVRKIKRGSNKNGKHRKKQDRCRKWEKKLVVVTMNVDDLRNREKREILAKMLTKMQIDIAIIQETHWVNNGEWEEGEYSFYVTAARKMKKKQRKKT